jgi:hypothetical protein
MIRAGLGIDANTSHVARTPAERRDSGVKYLTVFVEAGGKTERMVEP